MRISPPSIPPGQRATHWARKAEPSNCISFRLRRSQFSGRTARIGIGPLGAAGVFHNTRHRSPPNRRSSRKPGWSAWAKAVPAQRISASARMIRAIYARLEEAGYFYAIRLPANNVLWEKIAHRLTRPVGRPSMTKVKRFFVEFEYQAASWDKEQRVIAKIEWHPGELFPRVGFIVTNLPMDPDWVVRFYNQRGTAEQHIKEDKYAFRWTRLSCKRFRDNEVRLQLHALAYNLATLLRCIDLPEAMADWSLTSLQLKLIKIVARVVHHARAITFQLA